MLVRGILYVLVFLIEVMIFAKIRSPKVRQAALLAGSCALYLSWGFWFGAVLLTSIVMNYLLGKWIRQKPIASILWIGILLNLALLERFQVRTRNRDHRSSFITTSVSRISRCLWESRSGPSRR